MTDHERKPSRGSDEYWSYSVVTESESWCNMIPSRMYYGHSGSRNETRRNCSKRYCCNSHSSIATRLHTDSKMPLARDLSRRCFSQNGRGKRGKRTRGKGRMRKSDKSNNNTNKHNNHNNTGKIATNEKQGKEYEEVQRRGKHKKRMLKMYTQNVRTMSTLTGKKAAQTKMRVADKTAFVAYELEKFQADIACLQEIRWEGHGESEAMEGYTFYYSGNRDKKKEYGVGIAISKKLRMEIEPHYVNDRVMWATAKYEEGKYAIFSVYAPTEPHSMATKQDFYDTLQQQVRLVPKGYEIIMMGDWNARVGTDAELWYDIRGAFGGVEMGKECNDNGLLLQQFCMRNKLWIANTTFRKPKYATWTHARTKKEFTLDYCIAAKGLMRYVQNCGIERWMDCDTDHTAVKMEMYVEVAWKVSVVAGQKKKGKGADYKELVRNKGACKVIGKTISEQVQREVDSMKGEEVMSLARIMELVHKECTDALPKGEKREAHHKVWFNRDCEKMQEYIERKRAARISGDMRGYREMRNIIQRESREMENAFWDKIADNLISLEKQSDTKAYYEALKMVYGHQEGNASQGMPEKMLRADGITLTANKEETNARLIEHARTLFNPVDTTNMEEVEEYLPEQRSIDETLDRDFTVREYFEGVEGMRADKARGTDDIPAEALQFLETDEVANEIVRIYNTYLATGIVESHVKDVIVVYLFKKGGRTDCNNYRTLSLINHVGKILEKLVNKRLNSHAEGTELLPESQNGFRADRGTTDAMMVSRVVTSLCKERGMSLIKCFVDLTKAYDRVNRDVLWLVLARAGVPSKLIGLIKALHVGAKAYVRIDGVLAEPFYLNVGLKQGAVISALLFNIYFAAIMGAYHKRIVGKGVKLRYNMNSDIFDVNTVATRVGKGEIILQDILYADDAELLAAANTEEEAAKDMQEMVDILNKVTDVYGQAISIKKTEIMRLQHKGGSKSRRGKPVAIKISGQELKDIEEFKYVGGTENNTADMRTEIKIRKQRMAVAYSKYDGRVFSNKRIYLRIKLKVFLAFVISNGIYGCTTWNVTKKDIQQLESFQRLHLCKIFGFKWRDKISYEVIIQEALRVGVVIIPIACRMQLLRLKYVGHVERMGSRRWPKIMLHADVVREEVNDGDGNAHGPRNRDMNLRQRIRQDMKEAGIREAEWVDSANCRATWRKIVGVQGLNHALQTWYVKRDKVRCKRKEREVAVGREGRRTQELVKEKGSDSDSGDDSDREDDHEREEETDETEVTPIVTVQRAQSHHVDNQDRIRDIINGSNTKEVVEDYSHMSEAIRRGFITVRTIGKRSKTTETAMVQRFSTRRLKEEIDKVVVEVTTTCVETVKVIHARRNPTRGKGELNRWFATIEDAGYIIGTEWCTKTNLTEPIRRAIESNRNGEVGTYKYKWEWVLPTECYVETKTEA